MTATALLIIDVQKDLFRKKNSVYRGEEMLSNICELADRAHAAGVPVIYVQHENNTMPHGSDGWQLHPRLQPLDGDLLFQKQQSSALKVPPLKDALAKSGARRVIITGLVTHGCIKAACLDALKLGYEVILAADGQSNFNAQPKKVIAETLENLKVAGVIVKHTNEIKFA